MKNKIILLILLVLFLGTVYMTESTKDVELSTIAKEYKSEKLLDNMAKCSNRDLMQSFGLNYEDLKEHIYYKGTEALSADEVLIVKVENQNSLGAIKDAVETRISSQEAKYESYGIQQTGRLENAEVLQMGKYLFYCVAEDCSKYEEVFRDAVQ